MTDADLFPPPDAEQPAAGAAASVGEAPHAAAGLPPDAADPFTDLAAYTALPRIGGLVLSPDGTRLVATVAGVAPTGGSVVTALWDIDPQGRRPARRLTRSGSGESSATFLPGGDLLFTSKRPDPLAAADGEEEAPSLWLLPGGGAEARRVSSRPGGISAVTVARDSGTVVAATTALPGTLTAEQDSAARTARKDAGVAAILHTAMPVRYWDHDLGPAQRRLLTTDLFAAAGQGDQRAVADLEDEEPVELRDLTPAAGPALEDEAFVVTPDGRTVVTGWRTALPGGDLRTDLVAIDVATGERRVIAADPDGGASFSSPAASPDGRFLVCSRETPPTYDEPPDTTLWLVDLTTGEGRDLTPDLDLWPGDPVFAADSTAVLAVADELGHRPVLRVDVSSGVVSRLTTSGAYGSLCPAPDGSALYALRSSYAHPPQPVRLDLASPGAEPVVLPAPGRLERLPGRVEEVTATAEDGSALRAWLVLPDAATGADPAPLVLWIHGGPHGSWNDWSWRWCPHLLAARGYAVLLPDPALSTGYGREFLRRGWGQWGGTPFTDLMRITDAALERDDLDPTRTAAMGGSFGGYMANWVAGHTDRFRAIVTHASLWALEQFQGTTDHPAYWAREWGHSDARPERYAANSPHLHADDIHTPMLVVHGDKDFRVPIGEALRLWYDLTRRDVPAQFLYFPDENHWVLSPGNARVWYSAVLAFLDHHVLGRPLVRPDLL